MNISELSPEFIDSLNDEQRRILLKGIVEDATRIMEKPPLDEKERVSKTVEDKDQSSFLAPSKRYSVSSRVPVKGGENQWRDDGSISPTIDPDTKEVNEQLVTPKISLSKKGLRQAPRMIDVTCTMCHKPFEKREDLVSGNYHICHKCGGNR